MYSKLRNTDSRAGWSVMGDDSPLETMRWVCIQCDWSGDAAPVDWSRFEVKCPECDAVIHDGLRQDLVEMGAIDDGV